VLLAHLFEDLKDCKKHKNYQQFEQIQEKLLKPLIATSKSMMKQLNIKSYFKPEIANQFFKQFRKAIHADLHQVYDQMDLFLIVDKSS
jgi:hypothetical protein